MSIGIPVAIVAAIALVLAVMLSYASKVFAVEKDETFEALREELPGANCGACGYKGCDDYAHALSDDQTSDCNKCSVGGAAVAEKLATILGVSAGEEEQKCAVVMCNGTNEASKMIMEYKGMGSCKAAKQLFGGMYSCPYGCIGLGDCQAACDFDAIHVVNGVARVNRGKCTSCGVCARVCPNHIIRISPKKNVVFVRCSSTLKAAAAIKNCNNACIGCKKCEKTCKFDAVHVNDNLAYVDPDKCKNCGMCQKECPTGAIVNLRLLAKAKAGAGA